jgi:hypothetical protein
MCNAVVVSTTFFITVKYVLLTSNLPSMSFKQWTSDPGLCNSNLQQVLIARAVDEFKEKIKKLREDVERTGGVFGGAELALLEGNGKN